MIQESTGEDMASSDLGELLTFLLEDYDECIKVCWDLDATVSVLLRLMDGGLLRDLRLTNRARIGEFRIFYITGKIFSVSYGRYKMSLYGLQQYFPSLPEPSLTEVQALGMKLLAELKKMGMSPTKLTSPVAIYEECVLRGMDLPKLIDMPKEVAEYAWRCAGKLWIEAHRLGYWG
jgi:hypothetical protein